MSNNSELNLSLDTTKIHIADTVDLGKVLRVIYQNQPGVFLNNEQELITLAKFQWKEIYKLQAQESKLEVRKLKLDLEDANRMLKRSKEDLDKAQKEQLSAIRSYENVKFMLDRKTKENTELESSNKKYKKESTTYKIVTFVLMGVVTYVVITK